MREILILRPDNIGDCILFSGTLKHYRKLFSGDRITLAVQKGIIPLFEKCPYIDELIDFRELSYEKISSKKFSRWNFLNRIYLQVLYKVAPPKKVWDIIICPVRSVSRAMLWIVKYNQAKRKIGIAGCTTNFPANLQYLKTEAFSEYMTIKPDQEWQHEILTNLQFLNFLGANLQDEAVIHPEYWFNEEQLSLKIDFLSEIGPYTLLIPYGSLPHKELTNESYVNVVMAKSNTDTVLIAGVPDDYVRAEELKNLLIKSGKKSLNLCGKTSLIEFERLIRKAESVIAVDTGGLHFAIALNKVTYCIVGGGHWGRFFPWGNPKFVHWLNRKMDCYQCDWICKYGDFRCVSNLDLQKQTEDFN